MKKKYYLLLFVCGLMQSLFAQTNFNDAFYSIDSLESIGQPQVALEKVEKLQIQAKNEANQTLFLKCTVYKIKFLSYLQEDAIANIISNLDKEIKISDFPTRNILQSLEAEVYSKYYNQNQYKISQRSDIATQNTDFTFWGTTKLLEETAYLYEASLNAPNDLQNIAIEKYSAILTGNHDTRKYRPTLYDLLVNRALDYYLSRDASIKQPKPLFLLFNADLFKPAPTFVQINLTDEQANHSYLKGLKLIQQATAFHLAHKNDLAVADLELRKLDFIYNNTSIYNKDSLYLKRLEEIAKQNQLGVISFEATAKLAQYYYNKNEKTKALVYYQKIKELSTDSDSTYTIIAKNGIKAIENSFVSLNFENANIPNQAILGLINYRNTHQIIFKIYRINDDEIEKLPTNNYAINNRNIITDTLTAKLKNRTIYRSNTLNVPQFSDYQNHAYEFKLDALPAGNYYVLTENQDAEKKLILTYLKISNISVISSTQNKYQKNAFLVQERLSGKPLEKAKILVNGYNRTTKLTERIAEPFEKNSEGLHFVNAKTAEKYNFINLKIIDKKDTLNSERIPLTDANYNQYINQEKNTYIIYTDRAIYRPGQTVYFKGICFDKSEKKAKLATNFLAKFSAESQDGTKLADLELITNDFGSVEGSFVIPQQILNGRINLKVNNQFVNNVLLEEYKRPNFEITLAQETQHTRFNDSVTFKGKITAYNGYPLPNAKINYVIKQYLDYIPNLKQLNFNQELLKADTILSDRKGEFKITFLAAPKADISIEKQTINYNLEVNVTDENGETQSKTAYTRLKSNNILIYAQIPQKIVNNDVPTSFKISLKDFGYRPVKGNIEAEIIKIAPSKLYSKKRLFQKADSSLISLADYQLFFPDIEPIDKTKKTLKSEIIESLKINTDSSDFTLNFDKIKNLETGNYQIKIRAKSLNGDTVSNISNFYYINKPVIAQNMDNWLTVKKTEVQQNEKAEFSINLPNAYVLMEVYNEDKKIQSEWIKTGNEPKNISLSLADNNTLNISFLMVYKNRIYHHYEKIILVKKQEKLNYQFLNFRDKLEPGQKDKISLSITKANGKPFDAELLATMYDASLDVYATQNWQAIFHNKSAERFYYFNNSWNTYGFNNSIISNTTNNFYFNSYVIPKSYENIDLMGYNYYGGYNFAFNNYQNQIKQITINAYQDSLTKVQYVENAKLIKIGFDYSGRIINQQTGFGISGAIISLNGKNINTVSNSFGYFKIKVPENAVITVEYAGKKLTEITCTASSNYPIISINKTLHGEPGISDPNAQIMIRGASASSKNADIVINSPVGDGPVNSLREVVVGYGTQRKEGLTGAVSTMKTEDTNQIFTHIDNEIGRTLRTNFAETAFFYPQLKADSSGIFNLSFTLPDALTKWHFKAFAYDKELNKIAIDTQIVAQKSLMVQSNMPRFFRAGDTVNVKLRIINLTNNELNARLKVEFYNPLNNKVLNIALGEFKTNFSIMPNNNASAEISLAIPQQMEAIAYRFIADAGKFADGEQNIIPVLSNSILLTQSKTMMVKQGESKSFVFDDLVNNHSKTLQNKSLTFEWTANPNWLVAEAIPYLADPKYEGSETIFSALYANSIALVILDKNPGIKKYFANFKDSSSNKMLAHLEQNPELKSILLQENPWLKSAMNEKEQKRKLALFFAMDSSGRQQTAYIHQLKQLQLASGAFPWMNGTYEDQFISQYILAGFGQLKSFNALKNDDDKEAITQKLLTYVENKLKDKENAYLNAHAWYAISYFEKTVPPNLKNKWHEYVSNAKAHWLNFSLYQQTLAALTLSRFGEKEIAKTISNSITDRAIKTKDMGAYWPSQNWGCFWYQLPIETHALIIEMLEETAPGTPLLPELKLWLLRQKQTNNWGTTKATTLACYALLKQANMVENKAIAEIKLAGKNIFELKPDLKPDKETGYIKTSWLKDEIYPDLGKIEISKAPQTAFGALYWQFSEDQNNVKPAANGLTLTRKYYLKNQENHTYTEIDKNHQAKIGDLVKIIVTLKSDRDYEYLLLKDMRPSATEPTQQISRYNYQDGLYYYQVSKDVSTNFFINYLRKGNYVFEYELRVVQSGTFSTGISTIESMYAPEYRSNSRGERLTFKDNQ